VSVGGSYTETKRKSFSINRHGAVQQGGGRLGEALREAAWDALFLFPTLVLGPQKPGASSSTVKLEVAARLDL